jgi:IMP dehydrogenase/GMP reductase
MNVKTFDDIFIAPNFSSQVESRSDVDTGQTSFGRELSLPIVSAPMDTVFSMEMGRKLTSQQILTCLHRYCSFEERLEQQQELGDEYTVFPIGLNEVNRIDKLSNDTIILLDIANGHQLASTSRYSLEALEKRYVIYGNYAVPAINLLPRPHKEWYDAGRNIGIRIGIGGGSVCTTTSKTGIGLPTATSLMLFNEAREVGVNETYKYGYADANPALLIADGGIRNTSDIVKSLALGADLVMLGSMLAGHDESPGDVVTVNGIPYKEHRGMASKAAKQSYSGIRSDHVEGKTSLVPYKGPIQNTITEIKEALQSAAAYLNLHKVWRIKYDCKNNLYFK